jgi:hypothetical protein
MAGNMTNTVINGLLAELAERGITLAVDGGQLVARGPAGAMTPELAQRLKQHKAALVEALASGPAEAQAVKANAPAAAAPVAATASDAPAVELPPGWPADVAAPDWWTEFLSVKGSIEVLAARRQVCGDRGCGFEVAVEWEAPGCPRQWGCPACGRSADRG